MTSDADDINSDGTSPDTIFRELCMLRCSSCSRESKENSHVSSQCDPINFGSVYASEATEFNSTNNLLDPESSDSPSVLPHIDRSNRNFFNFPSKNDNSTKSNFNENPWFKRTSVCCHLNKSSNSYFPGSFWSRNLLSESLSRASPLVDSGTYHVSSRGTDTPQFDCNNWFKKPEWREINARSDSSQRTSVSESEDTSSIEYLVRERCSSPDCACDKRFRTRLLSYEPRIKFTKRRLGPKSVGFQVTETSLGLKLADWNGQIVIQEEDWESSMDSSRTMKRLGTDSEISVPSVLRLCQVSSASEHSSDSAITFLKKCSDCNILSTLGLKRDSTLTKSEMHGSQNLTSESMEGRNNKGQMVETYGKLLNKIEKLKKITSWKSKRRKNKLKYTLQGNEYHQEIIEQNCLNDYEKKCNWKEDEKRRQDATTLQLSSGDTAAVLTLSKEDSETEPDAHLIHPESKKENIPENQAIRTCEIGVQSVQSESFLTTIESSIDHNHRFRSQERKVTYEDADVQTVISRPERNVKECLSEKKDPSKSRTEKDKSRRQRPDSITSINSCNLLHGLDESLHNWGGRETQEEILDHLREINKLIEKESCASNSTHRICQSERNLGFEADKMTSSKRFSKINNDKSGFTKHIKKEGRVYWAVTKVTVYPDSCRTYEVMRLSRRRPQNVPSTSETVFVLLPNK